MPKKQSNTSRANRVTRSKPARTFKAPPEVCELLKTVGATRSVKCGKILFHKGEPPSGVYLVLGGRVALSAGDDPVRITRIAEPGSLLGLPATIREKPYSLTAEAVTDCEVCVISSSVLCKALATNPAIGMAVVTILAEEVSILRTLAVYKA